MRYNGNTKVMVPYMNTDGEREWGMMSFTGDVDRRRIYREVRKMVERTFNRKVTKAWLRNKVLIAAPGAVAEPTKQQLNALVEAFIERMQDAPEGQPDTSRQEGTAEETGGPLCSL